MNNLKENPLVVLLMFFILVPMLILTMGIGAGIIEGQDYQTAIEFKDTKEFNVSSNWTDKGTLNNLNTDSDIIYPDANNQGNWTSDIQFINNARLVDYKYSADMRNGNGNLIVNTWKDNLSGNPDKTKTINLESGINSNTLNLSNQDYFEFVFTLNETAGSSNQRPNVDYLFVDFNIIKDEQVGLDEGTTTAFYYIMMFLAVFSISFISFKAIKNSLF